MRVAAVAAFLAALVAAFFFARSTENGTPEGAAPARTAVGRTADAGPEVVDLAEASEARVDAARAGTAQLERTSSAARPRATDAVAVDIAPGFVVGRVVRADGAPLAAADAALEGQGGLGLFGVGADGGGAAMEVDADGRFRLESPPGDWVLVAGADGFAPLRRTVQLAAGRTVDVGDLALAPGVRIEGRVVDEDGRPVEKAAIRPAGMAMGGLFATGDSFGAVAHTDDGGRFVIERQAPGVYDFRVTHGAYPSSGFSGTTAAPGERVSGIEVVLRIGATIVGRTTGLDGLSATERAALRVVAAPRAEAEEERIFGSERRVELGEDGTFVVRGLEPGGEYALRLDNSRGWFGQGGRRSVDVETTAGDRNVLLAHEDGAEVTFRLVDANGAPVTGAKVQIGRGWRRPVEAELEASPGSYAIPNVWPGPEGTIGFDVTCEGFERYENDALALTGTVDVDLGELTLAARPQLVVTVLDARTRQPIEGATVAVSTATDDAQNNGFGFAGSVRFTTSTAGFPEESAGVETTDAEGVASLDATPGMRVHIDVTHPAFAEQRVQDVELASGETLFAHTVELEEGSTVVVKLSDDAGAPVAKRRIERRTSPGAPPAKAISTDEAGEARFTGLAPGTHGIRVADRAMGGILMDVVFAAGLGETDPDDWVELEVPPGEELTLELLTERASSIVGVVRENGEPLAGARVSFAPKGQGGMLMFAGLGDAGAETDGRGRFSIEDKGAGEGTLRVTHPTRAMPYEREVELEPGANEIDVELDVTVIAGTVKGGDGKPLAGVRVEAREKQPSGQSRAVSVSFATMGEGGGVSVLSGGSGAAVGTRTDAEGRFELRGVAAGRELVVVATDDVRKTVTSDPIEIAEGERRDGVDLAYGRGGEVRIVVADFAGEALVALRPAGGGEARTESFSGGSVVLKDMQPGAYGVTLVTLPSPMASGAAAPPRKGTTDDPNVTVVAGERATVEFSLE